MLILNSVSFIQRTYFLKLSWYSFSCIWLIQMQHKSCCKFTFRRLNLMGWKFATFAIVLVILILQSKALILIAKCILWWYVRNICKAFYNVSSFLNPFQMYVLKNKIRKKRSREIVHKPFYTLKNLNS